VPANPRKSPLYPPFIKGEKLIGVTPSHPPFLKASGSESLRLGEGTEGDFVINCERIIWRVRRPALLFLG